MKFTKTFGYSLCVSTLLSVSLAFAGPQSVAFTEENWAFIGGAEVVEYQGQQAVKLGVKQDGAMFGFGMAVLKEDPFVNGIIEYDILFDETRTFGGLRFRAQDAGNFENFYLRAHQSGNPDATQYMTNYNGVASWQLYYGDSYSAPVKFSFDEWMRVRLVISGNLADIYITDMDKPAYTVELKREENAGGVALWGLNIGGPVWVSNFSVEPMDSVEIKGTPVAETPASEGTILNWQISDRFDSGAIAGTGTLPEDLVAGLSYQTLEAEKTGMANLARLFGVEEGKDTVFAKLTINSESEQIKQFEFGFSDDVKMYLNGQPIFSGSDRFLSRDYRFLGTVGYYDTVYLSLKEGENELMIAITENVVDKTGWAVQGRFTDKTGITIAE